MDSNIKKLIALQEYRQKVLMLQDITKRLADGLIGEDEAIELVRKVESMEIEVDPSSAFANAIPLREPPFVICDN